MTVARLFPVILTADLPALVDFYEKVFGGAVTYRFQHEGTDVYVALELGGGTIGIGLEPEHPRAGAVGVWLYVDDVDAGFTAAVEAGAESIAEPEDRPWGERVAEVRDPDGNHLYLGRAVAG